MARWLLMAFDRCGTDRINLTHDDLAIAFGVRRPNVTLVVRSLQAARISCDHAPPNRRHRPTRLGADFVRLLPRDQEQLRAPVLASGLRAAVGL